MRNLSNLSTQAQMFLRTKIGYRTDDQSALANDIRQPEPIDVLDDEINDMGNTDIPDTLNEIYGTDFSDKIEPIDDFIKKTLNTDKYYLIWVTATKDDDEQYADDPESIYSIDFKDKKFMIVSDIGNEGFLIATVKDPLAL